MKAKTFFGDDYEKVLSAITGYTERGKAACETVSELSVHVNKAMVNVWDEGSIAQVQGYLRGKGDNITTRAWKDTVTTVYMDEIKFADKFVSNIEKCMVSHLKKIQRLESQ